MEKAINKFLQLLEKQEKKGFKDLATLLSHLPKPAQGSARSISVAEAMEAGFFSALDEVQSDMFTPSQLLVPRRSLPILDILGYPSLFGISLVNPCGPDIKGYPVFRWTVEVRRGVTRPAAAARQPGAEMNETYGMSTAEGISQDNSVLNYCPDLSLVLQVWPSYPNLSRDMRV